MGVPVERWHLWLVEAGVPCCDKSSRDFRGGGESIVAHGFGAFCSCLNVSIVFGPEEGEVITVGRGAPRAYIFHFLVGGKQRKIEEEGWDKM